jgi:putative transposase
LFHLVARSDPAVVLMYVLFWLSLRNVEDLLHERGIDLWQETARMWWNRFEPLFAGDIRLNGSVGFAGFTIGDGP